jgi:uridine phosphorylase
MSLHAPTDDVASRVNGHTFEGVRSPLLARRDHDQPSVFRPENLLREARRQKGIREGSVPRICVLDPDGDVARHVKQRHDARRSAAWACYHTELWEWSVAGTRHGIIGSAVGGAFAVLVAEQLFASGCEALISISSAGQIIPLAPPPYHILIDRALRDEGTSHHYLPPSEYASGNPALLALAAGAFRSAGYPVVTGATWTTDAPFRETAETIASRSAAGILAVEMEAAGLYAFAVACGLPVICLAHVTNQLGRIEGDFEKGAGNGAYSSMDLITAFSTAWRDMRSSHCCMK